MKQANILILRLSSIGDILLTSAFVRQTRKRFPDAQIDYIIKEQFSDLMRFNPHITNIYPVQPANGIKGLLKLRREIKTRNYDYIFDLHNNPRTKILTARFNRTSIHKDKIKRALLIYLKTNKFREIRSVPFKYLQVGAKAKIKDDQKGLELFWDESVENKAKKIVADFFLHQPFVVFAPGAAHFTKRWPLENFIQLSESLLKNTAYGIALLGSRQERASFEPLLVSDRVINLAGKLNLLESAAVLNKAQAIVSNDSGLMHMATAVQTPLVALFGSTVKELGFFPFRSRHIILEEKELSCRPCSHIGRKDCPKKHFNCMLNIKPPRVLEALEMVLQGKDD